MILETAENEKTRSCAYVKMKQNAAACLYREGNKTLKGLQLCPPDCCLSVVVNVSYTADCSSIKFAGRRGVISQASISEQ